MIRGQTCVHEYSIPGVHLSRRNIRFTSLSQGGMMMENLLIHPDHFSAASEETLRVIDRGREAPKTDAIIHTQE